MNKYEVINQTKETIEELDQIRNLLAFALKHENLTNVEFNVIIVDNEIIHALNRDYRHIDRPTDVISFALEDYKDIEYADKRLLGDIYISIDKAKSQAVEYGHSFLRELSFLTIHGLLHLLGYDHMKPEEEKIMFDKQEEILDAAGIKR
jgi:probable rRNA maturation factor